LYHTPPETFPAWVELRSRLEKWKKWIQVEKYGPGFYLIGNTLIIIPSEPISSSRGPLGWYFSQVNAKVYDKQPNVPVIIAIAHHDERKLRWAISKLPG
jgi:hypothetical protein